MAEPGLTSAQLEWEDGADRVRRLRSGLDERGNKAVDRAERALGAAITQRLGPSYALGDLYALYVDAERWARDVVADALSPVRLPSALTALVDAAFGRAAPGARDAR